MLFVDGKCYKSGVGQSLVLEWHCTQTGYVIKCSANGWQTSLEMRIGDGENITFHIALWINSRRTDEVM